MQIFRRVMGSIACVILAVMGVGVAIGSITSGDLAREADEGGRGAGFAALFRWLLEEIGAVPTGLLIVLASAGILALVWLPVIRANRA